MSVSNARQLAILTELREQAGLSLSQMAHRLGLHGTQSRKTAGAWERGEMRPQNSRRIRFMGYLWDDLRLRSEPKRFAEVWQVLVDEWHWNPVSDAEWRELTQTPQAHLVYAPRVPIVSPVSLEPPHPSGPILDSPTTDSASRPSEADPPGVAGFALPLDELPLPAPLPSNSLMPLSRNPLFVGRTQDLRAIAAALQDPSTTAVSQLDTAAATGLGGIGKTQLACEFVHRYGQFFIGGVFWLSFADPESIPAEVADCGGDGALELRPDFSRRALHDQVILVRAAWQAPTPRLLVFDNCEDPALLAQWRPTTGGCRILITSRRGDWELILGVNTLALDVLDRQESVALLAKHCPQADKAILYAIAEELGDLPLALHLAGSYLRGYPSVAPGAYLRQLRDPMLLHHRSMQGETFSPTGHVQHVGRTFALSYDRLDRTQARDDLAHTLLVHTAHFAPGEPVWYRLLVKTANLDPENVEDAQKADWAFARLIEVGLIESERDAQTGQRNVLRMHRLVAAFVCDVARDAVAASQTKVEEVVFAETARRNRALEPLPLLAWQIHLRAVVDVAKVREDEESARLCQELATYLWQIGDFAGGYPYAEKALAIREKYLAHSPLNVAESLTLLGRILRELGRVAEAKPHFERTLEIRLAAPGAGYDLLAESYDNLGRCLEALNQPQEGLELLQKALDISRAHFSEQNPRTAEYQNNVGFCLVTLMQPAEAIAHFVQALQINTQVLGAAHPATGLSHNNIGVMLHRMGQYDQARDHLVNALAIRRSALGPQHHETAQTLNALGGLLRDMGQLSEARTCIEEALAIYQQALGASHLRTSYCHRNLGKVLDRLGEHEQAHLHLQKAYIIRLNVVGAEHPLTIESQQDLGELDERSRLSQI